MKRMRTRTKTRNFFAPRATGRGGAVTLGGGAADAM